MFQMTFNGSDGINNEEAEKEEKKEAIGQTKANFWHFFSYIVDSI